MKIKQAKNKLLTLIVVGLLSFTALGSIYGSNIVWAEPLQTCPDGTTKPDDGTPCSATNSTTNNSASQSSSFCSSNPSECTAINPGGTTNTSTGADGRQCGKGEHVVKVSINIGCRGESYPGSNDVNPIIDMAFALFRFLSAGVGIVVIGSIILAGIQYSASRGNPQSTEASIKRVTNSVIALFLYLFIFAIANFLVPGGMFI